MYNLIYGETWLELNCLNIKDIYLISDQGRIMNKNGKLI